METWKHGISKEAIFFSLLVAAAAAATMADWGEWEEPGGAGGYERAPFLMKKSEVVVKTEGGEIRVFSGRSWNGHPARMHIGLVNMEPNTLLIPHYIDADLILFLLRGEAKIGWIHKDDLVDRQLKPGDILRIPAGSVFYLVNTGKDQRLQIISSIEPVDADRIADLFTPFFIGGGEYPRSVYAGFDIRTLTSAFNVSVVAFNQTPLKKSDISVYLVNLSAGSMMAPHVNPRATEYGMVIGGKGRVEVVNPNGTEAMKAEVREGDVFFVPRFMPFCQSAGGEGPMEILGFTTSARRNRPKFLAGRSSVLREMMGKEMAAGFGVGEEEFREVVMKQNESVILGS